MVGVSKKNTEDRTPATLALVIPVRMVHRYHWLHCDKNREEMPKWSPKTEEGLSGVIDRVNTTC
jgi:hypothetical protein